MITSARWRGSRSCYKVEESPIFEPSAPFLPEPNVTTSTPLDVSTEDPPLTARIEVCLVLALDSCVVHAPRAHPITSSALVENRGSLRKDDSQLMIGCRRSHLVIGCRPSYPLTHALRRATLQSGLVPSRDHGGPASLYHGVCDASAPSHIRYRYCTIAI